MEGEEYSDCLSDFSWASETDDPEYRPVNAREAEYLPDSLDDDADEDRVKTVDGSSAEEPPICVIGWTWSLHPEMKWRVLRVWSQEDDE